MQRALPILFVVSLVACTRNSAPPTPTITDPPSRGLERAIENGCYRIHEGRFPIRSDVYATFKDGTALTPLAATVWQDDGNSYSELVRQRAVSWLGRKAKPDGTIDEGPDGFPYPVYTAALTLTAICRSDLEQAHPEVRAAREAWLKYLL